jgi:GAF domain-containing protein/HAMP domain-containing protein
MRRFFRLSSYPFWLKLLVIFALAAALLVLPGIVLMRSAIENIAFENGAAYVTQIGSSQAAAISSNINQAELSMTTFVTNPANLLPMTSMLIGEINSDVDLGLPSVRDDDIEDLFNRTILNPATTLYEYVRLVNRDGRVVASAALSTALGLASNNESDSDAFLQAQANTLAGQTSALTVTSTYGIGTIEYSRAIQWRDGSTLGYVIGRISNSRAIYPNLRFPREGFDGFSFLQSSTGVVLSPTERRFQVVGENTANLVNAGLSGATGTTAFNIEDTEFIGFYSAVRGTPLALVAQIQAADPLNAAAIQFDTRNFVVLLGGGLITVVLSLLIYTLIAPPLARLRRAADGIAVGDLETPIPETDRADEIGRLAGSMEAMRSTLNSQVTDLQQRIAARTRDIEATQDITRYALAERELERLMTRVVNLIVDRFPNIYHAQIFLLDSEHQFAVVRASTGPVGQELLRRGHRLAVGSISVIGQVTEQGRLILARDTSTSQVHRRNEFLPDTRAELAIPLQIGSETIGALDVQSKEPDAFNDDLIAVLQTMAEQLAIAIENARLFEENNRRAREIEAANRETTRRAWADFLLDQRRGEIVHAFGPADAESVSDVRQRAIREGRPVAGERTARNTIPVAVPIQLRGETLGVVEWELPAVSFSEDKLELARELVGRLAISLENARLFTESRRAAERERQVNQIAAQLTTQSSIDDILKTAVREIGQALGAPQVTIRMQGETPAASVRDSQEAAASQEHQPSQPVAEPAR